jgi:hypothetical protein
MNEIAMPRVATIETNQDGLIEACARLSGVELPVPPTNA